MVAIFARRCLHPDVNPRVPLCRSTTPGLASTSEYSKHGRMDAMLRSQMLSAAGYLAGTRRRRTGS